MKIGEDMIKGAIFDLDGVILDSMIVWEKAGEMFLNSLGIQAESGVDKILFSMSMSEGAKYMKDRYCLDMNEDEIVEAVNHTIMDFYSHQVKLKEGVKQFLKGMHQYGIKIVAATSCDRMVFETALDRLNVMSYFQKIFTSTEIGVGKVKPDIYLAAAEYMGILPKDIWVFEDALYAIQTAKSAGFRTVGVYDASSIDDIEEIKRVSDIYLSNMEHFHVFLEKVMFFN
ncbi:HAD family hydrolase [Lutispora thermophila]|uniref:Haloacid dehalogenase superfamily, subfamily IA, variant 3 with third motif having DD or ED n=1 Tax=Lutispora thermophila DSM 19022 TaxID=1122184 RepID=A0A1M6CZT9_9FIRM|nr:HAD family phosphatase [Lutispora thermophila]SHI66489.1 haloacid dehalogenase superfamily, subfamily IA, variant 3 with third motif having DD or ED [Lutispora thermophila DSM 19022]